MTGDREATQEFSLRNILVGHCGEVLTPKCIENIVAELMQEIKTGGTRWAFAEKDNDLAVPSTAN